MQQGWPSGASPLGSKKLTGAAAWLSPNRPPERDGRGHSDLSNQGLAVTTECEAGAHGDLLDSLFWPLSGLGRSLEVAPHKAGVTGQSVSWPRRPCAVAGHTARADARNHSIDGLSAGLADFQRRCTGRCWLECEMAKTAVCGGGAHG